MAAPHEHTASAYPRVTRQLEAHLRDPFTSRDLFGVVRGPCSTPGCTTCVGGYLKRTADYVVQPEDLDTNGRGDASRDVSRRRPHPHNDPSLTNCTRCGCPAGAHEVAEGCNARAMGNDAFATGDLKRAVAAYSRAIAEAPGDARGYSNRAAALIAMVGETA